MTEQAFEHEIECLNTLLVRTESSHSFCHAHELVNRNHITTNTKKILKATRFSELKPFRFLLNKN